ncbi:MAG: glycoside hydrolase family 57 protein [Candidatus Magasanikbacteria bacterium]
MPSVCFYFQVHQPCRVKKYQVFDIGEDHDYFFNPQDEKLDNERIFDKVSKNCYLKTNNLILELLEEVPDFKCAFSLSGIFLDQAREFSREVLDSFSELINHPKVEILSETYHHSLAFLHSEAEFRRQVNLHREEVRDLFSADPEIFRNTELIFNDDLAKTISDMGYEAMLAEGEDSMLGWRSPDFIYNARAAQDLKLLLKNYRLSDDIAFRFSNEDWEDYPLTAEKFANWIHSKNGNGEVVNLFMDYETFGEHQWEDTGIFDFFKQMPKEILKHPDNDFVTPSEAIDKYEPKDEVGTEDYISWADVERDLSAWTENKLQQQALKNIYQLEDKVLSVENDKIKEDWRRLQTSDHFYYMCTKWFEDGDVHAYFNPYETPYEAFTTYMNVLKDLEYRIKKS